MLAVCHGPHAAQPLRGLGAIGLVTPAGMPERFSRSPAAKALVKDS
jgi:hypothetical protein